MGITGLTHGLRYQGVVCPNGIIEQLYGPVEGIRHDARVLNESELLEQLESSGFFDEHTENTYYLYGDPAYPLHPHLIRPHLGRNSTPAQVEFNRSYSSVRISVEHSFSLITQVWTALDFKRQEKILLTNVGKRFKLAAVLTNIRTILRQKNKISTYFDDFPTPTLDEDFSFGFSALLPVWLLVGQETSFFDADFQQEVDFQQVIT